MGFTLKKGILATIFGVSLILSFSALAGGIFEAPIAKPYFDGFYLGIGGGVVSSTAVVDGAVNGYVHMPDGNDFVKFNGSHSADFGKHGLNANIFVGFGKTLKSSFYLGGELYGNYFTPRIKGSYDYMVKNGMTVDNQYPASGSAKIKSPYSYGGDLRIGYLFTPKTMIYVLFGLDYAKFDVENEMAAGAVIGGNNFVTNISDKFSKYLLGYMPGIGIETALAKHLSFRAQYTYTFYPSFSHDATKDGIFIDQKFERPFPYKIDMKTKIKPSRGLFTIMLSYLFN